MNDQRQFTPTIGPLKLVLIGLVTVAIVWYVIRSAVPPRNDSGYNESELLPVGCIYGILAAGCWLTSAADHRYGRLVLRAMIVIGASSLLGLVREHRPWFQTAADLAGIAIVQCVFFAWIQVPRWRGSWKATTDRQQMSEDQFAIADIAIATTVIAILFSFAIRYSPEIRPVAYWLVLAAVWIGGSATTTCIAKGMTSKETWRTLVLFAAAISLAFIGTYSVAAIDSIIDEGQISEVGIRNLAAFYGRIVFGYLLTFAFFASLTRISPQ